MDSDALIQAFRYDFPPNDDPGGFWSWIEESGNGHQILICDKVFEEIEKGNDSLYSFLAGLSTIRREAVASALPHLPTVMSAYGEMEDVDLEAIDRTADPYLVAHAIGLEGTVITNEVSRPGVTAARKKKIPDICSLLSVPCMRYPRFLWNMGRIR